MNTHVQGLATEADVKAPRAFSKACNFAQSFAVTPRWASLRRMACGRWRVAGKCYRTKELACKGAAKRGFKAVELPKIKALTARYFEAWPVMREWSVDFGRSSTQVVVEVDGFCRPLDQLHVYVKGESVGLYTTTPSEGTTPAPVKVLRTYSRGGTDTAMRHFAVVEVRGA